MKGKARTKGTVYLFQWDPASASRRAADLRAAGWNVIGVEAEDGARGGKAALAAQPDAIVFDLAQRPSHSYATAEGIRGYKAGRGLKLLFVSVGSFGDGTDEVIAKTKARVKDGVFTTTAELAETLDVLTANR